jgi:hypothetical protein
MQMNELSEMRREEVRSLVNAGMCRFVNRLTTADADDVNGMTKVTVAA